jgi:hypothetical protein
MSMKKTSKKQKKQQPINPEKQKLQSQWVAAVVELGKAQLKKDIILSEEKRLKEVCATLSEQIKKFDPENG